jgi:hypothetical protein
MGVVVYESISKYVESASSLEAKLAKIDAAMLVLFDALIKVATNDHIDEYRLDNGQTIIHTKYKSAAQVQKGIDGLQFARDKLLAVLNKNKFGHIQRLVDSKNMNGYNNGNGR